MAVHSSALTWPSWSTVHTEEVWKVQGEGSLGAVAHSLGPSEPTGWWHLRGFPGESQVLAVLVRVEEAFEAQGGQCSGSGALVACMWRPGGSGKAGAHPYSTGRCLSLLL